MAQATAIDPRPIKEALLFIESIEGKRPYSAEMDSIRLFLSQYDLTPDAKTNPKTYYLRESLKGYLSCKSQGIPLAEFRNWGRMGGLNDNQLGFVEQVGDAWIQHWTQQQRQMVPVQRAPIESSRPKPTQVQTVLQTPDNIGIELAEPADMVVADPGDMVVATTPEGLRLVEVINRAMTADSGISFKLLNVLNGVRVTEYRIIQDLASKDGKGKPARLLAPEKIDTLASTLKVYAKTGVTPVSFPGDGCIVIQVAKDDFEPVPIERHIGNKAFSGKCDRPLYVPVGLGMNRELVGFELEGHACIGGQTRGGKTSEQDAIAFYLMNNYAPHLLRLAMVDPQRVNFADYDGLPWLLGGKVLSTKEDVARVINHIYAEKDRREELLLQHRRRNFLSYNQMVSQAIAQGQASVTDYLPFIVVMIDEQAELKSLFDIIDDPDNKDELNGDQLMDSLIQIARAFAKFGIHLIIATQRPSKEAGGAFSSHLAANVAIRIAFRTADEANSQIILGEGYKMASKLRGKGDGYLVSPLHEMPLRFQGFWADPDRVIRPFCEKFRGYQWTPTTDPKKGWCRSGGMYPEELAIARWEPELFPIPDDPTMDPPVVENSDPIGSAIAQLRHKAPDLSETAIINTLTEKGLLSGQWKKKQETVRKYL